MFRWFSQPQKSPVIDISWLQVGVGFNLLRPVETSKEHIGAHILRHNVYSDHSESMRLGKLLATPALPVAESSSPLLPLA